jgi:60 kDa SS-A/Ro ribonucleoprotein
MMLLTAKTEEEFEVVAFSEGLTELNVNKEDTLETAIAECSRLDCSITDCALPMKWAMDKKKEIRCIHRIHGL